ncbi:hypothetical protein [Blastochloris tepida]|jgi:hypothetical protein|uniref:Uncharacterized protein n=1 Tax=Blastochloris tepida TaxID=2233851 RepID=A0A348FY86_9HYPH|nr:hypothetical protein [Blastochloris tepida]BBF92269.1 hypothetical protein BLTE_09540 [Blastochloris tepida]
MRPPFLPSPRATSVLIAAGFLAVGWAMYVRYLVIENSTVGLACEAGLATTMCGMRRIVTLLFNYSVFGWIALAAALAHLTRPHVALFALALVAGGIGVVLYNKELAALALGLLVISFARPAPAAA